MLRYFFAVILLVVTPAMALSAIYVDALNVDSRFSGEALNCSTPLDNDYNPSTRQCGDGTATVYSTIQEAILNCTVGDTIQVRNGIWEEYDIDIPESKNGSSWENGNFTTIRSYPDEWAVLDGSASPLSAIIRHPTTNNKDQTNPTKYWKFERLEFTGSKFGILLTHGPIWVRYCYFHDCIADVIGDEPMAPLWVNEAQESIIEYNYFYNSYDLSPGTNDSLIGFSADYHDETVDGAEGEAYEATASIRGNIIRYNMLDGNGHTNIGIHYKGDQRFGYNSRNPSAVRDSYPDNGDEIHHNVILNMGSILKHSIMVGQDNIWIHHNITDGFISAAGWQHVPQVYNQVVNNNTLRGAHASINISGGVVIDSNQIQHNCYDSGFDCDPLNGYEHTVTPNTWLYSNIIADNEGGYSWDEPINIVHYMIDDWGLIDGESYTHDFSKTVVTNNLFHNCPDVVFRTGSCDNEISPSTCADGGLNDSTQSISEFNSHSATWRGVDSVINWDVDTSELFKSADPLDPSYWITEGAYIVDSGNTTIDNGGVGVIHPYRSNFTLSPYIGAVNQDDSAWVGGLINDLTSTTWLRSTTIGRDDNDIPTWIVSNNSVDPDNPSNGSSAPSSGSSGGGCFAQGLLKNEKRH